MSSSAITHQADVRAALTELCERNVSAELHYGKGDAVHQARVRLLAMIEDELCTDRPQSVGTTEPLHSGDAVRVYFVRDGQRYVFDSRMISSRRSVRINARMTVPGMALAVPDEIRAEQRRRDYRVSVASHNIACTTALQSVTDPGACALDAQVITGQVANVSARGAGVLFPESARVLLPAGALVFMEFTLPEDGGLFVVLAEVRHVRDVHERDTCIAGMRIVLHAQLGGLQVRTRLARFVVSEQRRMLRRRR